MISVIGVRISCAVFMKKRILSSSYCFCIWLFLKRRNIYTMDAKIQIYATHAQIESHHGCETSIITLFSEMICPSLRRILLTLNLYIPGDMLVYFTNTLDDGSLHDFS